MMRPFRHLLLIATLACAQQACAMDPRDCAANVDDLRKLASDSSFPLKWEETSMSDGKPLLVTITEREGVLFLAFVKSQEGLWAQGHVEVCAPGVANTDLEARMAKGRIRTGPAANWLLRHSLGQGATFTLHKLASGRLRIATTGWSGVFAAVRD